MERSKILLILLNSNGDCLYGTVIARQIKEIDYPGCHLTWAVNSRCKQSIENNPWIDRIWTVDTKKTLTDVNEWTEFLLLAEQKREEGEFDLIFPLQIQGDNILNFDGGIRSSLYSNYPHPIRIIQQPEIYLYAEEVDRVAAFASKYRLFDFKKVFLLECGPESFSSSLHQDNIKETLERLIADHKDIVFILSSGKKISYANHQIIDGSELSFRENAELTKYCHFFIGCSSGITWITTTQWAKPIRKVIFTNLKDFYSSSFLHDHQFASLPCDDVIEIQSGKNDMQILSQVIECFVRDDFSKAKSLYHTEFKLRNFKFVYTISKALIKKGYFFVPFKVFKNVSKRNYVSWRAIWYLLKAYLKSPIYVFQKQKP